MPLKLLLVNPSRPRRGNARHRPGKSRAPGARGSRKKRRLTPAQIAAGFGGKRAQRRAKTRSQRRSGKNRVVRVRDQSGRVHLAKFDPVHGKLRKLKRKNPRRRASGSTVMKIRRRRRGRKNPFNKRSARAAANKYWSSAKGRRRRAAMKGVGVKRKRRGSKKKRKNPGRSRRHRRRAKKQVIVVVAPKRRRRRKGRKARSNPRRRRRRHAVVLTNPGHRRRRRRRHHALVLANPGKKKKGRKGKRKGSRSRRRRSGALARWHGAYAPAFKRTKAARGYAMVRRRPSTTALASYGLPRSNPGSMSGLMSILPQIGIGAVAGLGILAGAYKVGGILGSKLPASIPAAVKSQVPTLLAGVATGGLWFLTRKVKALNKASIWVAGAGGLATALLLVAGIRLKAKAADGSDTTVSLAQKIGVPLGEYTRLGAAGGSARGIFNGTDDDEQFGEYTRMGGTDDDEPIAEDDEGVLSGDIFD